MKNSKIFFGLFGLIIAIFLISNVSAIPTSYGEWQDGSSSLTITNGQNAGFNFYFESTTVPFTASIKLYDSSNNLIHTFIEQPVSQTYYFNDAVVNVTPADYSSTGNFLLVFSSTDSQGTSTMSTALTVSPVPPANNAPVITSTAITSVNENTSYSYQVSVTDADGDTLTYSISGAPSGFAISSSGLITGTAPLVAADTNYSVSVSVSDGTTSVTQTYTLTVKNVIGNVPVITLTGANNISVMQGATYTDAGATATDVEDGVLTASIITTGLPINTSILGTYIVTYDVTDSDGNSAVQITRTVNVVSVPIGNNPVISLIGSNPITITKGGTYTEFGATATDVEDGVLSVTITGTVNTNIVGTYIITYSATDSSTNTVTITRTVNVVAPSTSKNKGKSSGNIISSPTVAPETPSQGASVTSQPINLGGHGESSKITGTTLFIILTSILILGAGAAVIVLVRKR